MPGEDLARVRELVRADVFLDALPMFAQFSNKRFIYDDILTFSVIEVEDDAKADGTKAEEGLEAEDDDVPDAKEAENRH